MDKGIAQLMEMGLTAAQARRALSKYKDVMRAAERFFEGEFEDAMDDDVEDIPGQTEQRRRAERPRMITPREDTDSNVEDEDDADVDDVDDSVDEFLDYDSDQYTRPEQGENAVNAADPYAGIFFSKDRKEEVIEVEEDPETVLMNGYSAPLKLMSQGQWMKGCPEGSEQSFLFGIYSSLSEGSCACPERCGFSIPRIKADFFAIFPDFSTYIAHIQNLLRKHCPNCSNSFCFACGELATPERDPFGRLVLSNDPLFHCANVQGVILGMGLSMLENMFAEQLNNSGETRINVGNTKKRKAMARAPARHMDPDDDDDVHYAGTSGKKAKGGIGYAGSRTEDQSGQIEALAAQKVKDERIASLLKEIRVYLPNVHREEGSKTSDYMPHPTTLAHLRRRFNFVSSNLLRNDSLSDMSDRSVLYFELFEWLETISNHEALASMMAMPIMVPVSVKYANTKRTARSSQIRERTVIYEGSSGPRELLEAIVIQAQAATKGLEGFKPLDSTEQLSLGDKQDKQTDLDIKGKYRSRSGETAATALAENEQLLSFCKRIITTAAAIDRGLLEMKGEGFMRRLKESLPENPTSTTKSLESYNMLNAGMTNEDIQSTYIKWAKNARFEYCDLTIPPLEGLKANCDWSPNFKHHFNNEARQLQNSDIPKRALAIAKELAVLTTNLPIAWDSSIFLRVDESRVDIIKALITGPEGTPYHNGCFVFDIFLNANYNQIPPSVKYMTTNGGRFRFNPNLYADGKVCLSLLGTWSGPGWVSGKSTLLQVLISIQSMILCDEPYLNEPGWANGAGSAASKSYSANVRRMVVHTAMLGNLKNPPEPFAGVIRNHFRLKARSITAQLDEWLAQDDGKPMNGDGAYYGDNPLASADKAQGSSSGFVRDVEELKKMLAQLQMVDFVLEGSSSGSS